VNDLAVALGVTKTYVPLFEVLNLLPSCPGKLLFVRCSCRTLTFSLLHRLNLIASDSHGNGSLNQLYRDDHTLVAADCRKDSLDSIEAPSPNTDALPDVQKWIKLKRNALLQHGVDSLNLGIGNRGANTANTYKVVYADGAQYRNSLVLHRSNSHKHVCRK
jgi:hypothetical protein